MLTRNTIDKHFPLAHRRQSKFPSCRPWLRGAFCQRVLLTGRNIHSISNRRYCQVRQRGEQLSPHICLSSPFGIVDILNFQRGIDVLAEIDTPGHTSVISKTFPEHIACPEATPWSTYANEPPAGQLRIASPDTVNFTTSLLVNAAKMFPGNYFSTGGDEINAKCYADDLPTQKALNASGKTFEQALDDFTQAEHKALKGIGKTAVVWQEMVLDHNVTLANDTVIM